MRLLLLLFALGSAAQGAVAQTSSRPDPADPSTPVPAVKLESAFTGYQPFQAQQVGQWKGINDQVGGTPAVGGHGGMMMAPARQEAAPPGSSAEKPAKKPMAGHELHDMGKGEKQ